MTIWVKLLLQAPALVSNGNRQSKHTFFTVDALSTRNGHSSPNDAAGNREKKTPTTGIDDLPGVGWDTLVRCCVEGRLEVRGGTTRRFYLDLGINYAIHFPKGEVPPTIPDKVGISAVRSVGTPACKPTIRHAPANWTALAIETDDILDIVRPQLL